MPQVRCLWCLRIVEMPPDCNSRRPFVVNGEAHFFNRDRGRSRKALPVVAAQNQPLTWAEVQARAQAFWDERAQLCGEGVIDDIA
jgi:hypothetical protein